MKNWKKCLPGSTHKKIKELLSELLPEGIDIFSTDDIEIKDFIDMEEGIYENEKKKKILLITVPLYFIGRLDDANKKVFEDLFKLYNMYGLFFNDLNVESNFIFLGMMSRGLAHEINNPLCIIASYIQYLQLIENDEEKLQIYKNILDTVFRANEIIKKISLFAKTDSKTAKYELKTVTEGNIKFFNNIAKYRFPNITIKTDFPEEDISININEAEFQMIIYSLLLNSCEAYNNEKGEIYLTISSEEKYIRLSIIDNAGGIKKKALKQVFIPFFTTKEKKQGKGLGLSISRHLAKKNNLAIEIESAPDVGTKVIITAEKI